MCERFFRLTRQLADPQETICQQSLDVAQGMHGPTKMAAMVDQWITSAPGMV
jgi:hypothetical protein